MIIQAVRICDTLIKFIKMYLFTKSIANSIFASLSFVTSSYKTETIEI